MPSIDTRELQDILNDSLRDLRGLEPEVRAKIVAKYMPRLESIAANEDRSAAADEWDDVSTNFRAELRLIGIKAETVLGKTVVRVLSTVAKMLIATI